MSFFKRQTKSSETKTSIDDDYEHLEHYQGNYKSNKRHGQGVYYYDNGDIYDGEWRKGRKEGYGIYTFANGKRSVGWFYRDEYVGKEPNEKLKRKMNDNKKSSFDDAKPLRVENEGKSNPESDSQSEEENDKKLGGCQELYNNCKEMREKVARDKC